MLPLLLFFGCVLASSVTNETDYITQTTTILTDLDNLHILTLIFFSTFATNLLTGIITDSVVKRGKVTGYFEICSLCYEAES